MWPRDLFTVKGFGFEWYGVFQNEPGFNGPLFLKKLNP